MCINGYKKHSIRETYPFCDRCGLKVGKSQPAKGPKKVGACLTEHLRFGVDPLAEGWDAYHGGWPQTTNPYKRATKPEKYLAWLQGWTDAAHDVLKKVG